MHNHREFIVVKELFDLQFSAIIQPNGDLKSSTNTAQHLFDNDNIGLLLPKNGKTNYAFYPFIMKQFLHANIIGLNEHARLLPLYRSNTQGKNDILPKSGRVPNINKVFLKKVEKGLGLLFIPEAQEGNVCFSTNNNEIRDDFKTVFTPIDFLDYLYAVMHHPRYQQWLTEKLATQIIIPLPTQTNFWTFVKYGQKLRLLHLLKCPDVNHFITNFPVKDNNLISTNEFPLFRLSHQENKNTGCIQINKTQYFDHVPIEAWDFSIGNIQPLQQWLKKRKATTLSTNDINYFHKMVIALYKTQKIQNELQQLSTPF
ncbi:MAG TPA: type ISP restriction/modification enzyme [Chitinophagaceae bacterium]|nr:type ISP restriction/modification enzyme [Chitinophagaceae bacterium]